MPKASYDNLLKRYARYAPDYDRRWAKYSSVTLHEALAAIPLDDEAWLLDVACGTGLLAGMVRESRPRLHIAGVDVSPQMLEVARQRLSSTAQSRVEWFVGRAEELPVESGRFDVVTCTSAFHLVQDQDATLEEFRRVLKPGGTLVIVDWSRDSTLTRMDDLVLRVIDRQRRTIRSIDEMTTMLRQAGFAIETTRRFRAGMFGLMCIVSRSAMLLGSMVEAPARGHASHHMVAGDL